MPSGLKMVLNVPLLNQRSSERHLVNTKVYKAEISFIDVSVNVKKHY